MNVAQSIISRYLPRAKENKNFSICLTCYKIPYTEWENIQKELSKQWPNYTFTWGRRPGVLAALYNDSKQNSSTL